MKWCKFKDPVSYLCLASVWVTLESLTQEV